MFTAIDWSAILQACVDIENLPAVDGGLKAVNPAFSAVKYEPTRLSGYPRSYRLDWGVIVNSRSAPGGGTTMGVQNYDGWLQIGYAVAAANEPRSTAQPKAEAFADPIYNLYWSHLTLNDTVDYLGPNGMRMELGVFQPPAQQHFGLLVYIPFRKIISREIAP